MGALSYADDITFLSPSLRGLIEMLHIVKISALIGSVNKFKLNVGHLQGIVYLLFSNRIVVHIIVVKCGSLIH